MADERLRVILELVTGNYKKEAREASTATDSIATKAKAAGTETGKLGSRMGNMSGGLKLAVAAGAAFVGTRIVGFMQDASKAAAEDESSQKQLALALKNTTGATDTQIASVETWIDGMARSRGVADDELRPALANLVRASGDVETAQGDLGTAMDIAAARGLDLNTVTLAMSKAQLGNVGALGRLGIATKNAAGETLTYDEVLTEASRTMGGAAMTASMSLEGQLKRQTVAWEEQKETLGTQVIPMMGVAADTFSFFASKVAGDTEHAITVMSIAFNDLVKQGIDPTLDPMRSFVAILVESEKKVATNSDSLNILLGMLDLEGQSLQVATDYLIDHGTELGLNEEQVGNLVTQLRIEDQAARDAARGLGVSRDALKENTVATLDNLNAIKELTDPLFGLFQAQDRVRTATETYTKALRDNGPYSQDTKDAAIDLAKAQQDVNISALRYAEEGGAASEAAFIDLAREAGISEGIIQSVIRAIDTANARPFRRITTRGDLDDSERTFAGRQHGGPVSRHRMYQAGEGNRPELLIIPGDNGRVFSNADSMRLFHALAAGGVGGGGSSINIGALQLQGLPAHLAHQVGQAMALELRMA